jgi:hypothetical protein
VYLLKLPRADRKLRVMLDWTLDLFFPRDLVHLNPRFSNPVKEIYLDRNDRLEGIATVMDLLAVRGDGDRDGKTGTPH